MKLRIAAISLVLVIAAVLVAHTKPKPPKPVQCQWEATCVGPVLDSLNDPANGNYCTPPPMTMLGNRSVPQQHRHPVTGERVGAYIP